MDTNMIIGVAVVIVVLMVALIAALLIRRSRNGRTGGRETASEQSVQNDTTTSVSEDRTTSQSSAPSDGSGVGNTKAPTASRVSMRTSEEPDGSVESSRDESSRDETSRHETSHAASATSAAGRMEVETPESSDSRLVRLKARLSKSSNAFGKALFSILAKDHLSETDWEDVEDTLLLADVGAEASEELIDELRADARITGTADPEQVRDALRAKLLDLVGTRTDRRLNADKPEATTPSVIIMVGVNGTGKTTTAGKLARLFVAEGKSVVMGAADTFRAAAADQLETWGAKVAVPVVRADKDGADPASVAYRAAQRAKDDHADVLIIDTAGRLQNKANLMDELGKIRRVTEKILPVDEVLLVLDATTGQNGMVQAKVFAEAIGITGVVLSKLDGSAKGGIVVSVQKELQVPVKLVGLGEGPDDLAPFNAEGFVDGILA